MLNKVDKSQLNFQNVGLLCPVKVKEIIKNQ